MVLLPPAPNRIPLATRQLVAVQNNGRSHPQTPLLHAFSNPHGSPTASRQHPLSSSCALMLCRPHRRHVGPLYTFSLSTDPPHRVQIAELGHLTIHVLLSLALPQASSVSRHSLASAPGTFQSLLGS